MSADGRSADTMDGLHLNAHLRIMGPDLPLDLRFAVASISERFNACRLVSLMDVNGELPARDLSRDEVDRVLKALADHGIRVLDDDAADHLAA